MGGKKTPAPPPPPDYTPIAQANQAAAQLQYDLGQQQLAWAKQQDAENQALNKRLVDAALATQEAQNEAAAKDRQRYETTFQPLEDQLVKDAKSYDSGQRQDMHAGRAMALVSQNFEQARQNAEANLESYGIDPSQTRYAALDLQTRTAEAAARASAGNNSYMQDEAVGRAIRDDAINVGRGYPGQSTTEYASGLQAGNSAINSSLATTASGASTMGTDMQYQALGNQSVGNWGNLLLGADKNNIARYSAYTDAKAKTQQSSGIGSILGMVGGMATKAFMFADGGPVPDNAGDEGPRRTALPDMDGDEGMPGLPVPPSASPSGGAQTDDVPARLNAGEFVVPKDVVAFKGEEFFQRLIQKTRQQEQGPDQARPRTAAIPAEAPALRSTLPMG